MSEHPTRPTAVTPDPAETRREPTPNGDERSVDQPSPPQSPESQNGRARAPESGALETGTIVSGRYRLVAPIATGGMATVWHAIDQILTRPVAIKVLHARLAADPEFVARFRREAVAAARLAHPSIVAIYDTCTDPEAIVMELVEGHTLRAELDRRGFLPPAEAVEIASGIAQALEVAHKAGLVHRDVKPANVLLSHDGRLKVADFGIAKAARRGGVDDEDPELPDLTAIGHMVGTPKYLAPEQVSGGTIDARTDVYALGAVLYEMLCGRPPFSGDNDLATATARLHAMPPRPRSVLRTIPTRLDEITMRALSTDPANRYDSASSMWADLQSVSVDSEVGGSVGSEDEGVDATTITAAPSFTKEERSWLVPALLVTVVAVALGLAWLLIGGTEARRDLINLVDRVSPGRGGADASQVEPITGLRATAFDPIGRDGENDAEAGLATDGDPATFWQTERYDTRDFGGLKDGVGIYVELDDAADLDELVIDAQSEAWTAEVYIGDEPSAGIADWELADWGEPVATVPESGAAPRTVELDGRGTAVLLWITDPGVAPDGRFRFELQELSLTGS